MPASALDLSELSHELAAVDLAGDGLTLRVKAQPARALAVGRNTLIGNEISHGSASKAAGGKNLLLYTLDIWCIH